MLNTKRTLDSYFKSYVEVFYVDESMRMANILLWFFLWYYKISTLPKLYIYLYIYGQSARPGMNSQETATDLADLPFFFTRIIFHDFFFSKSHKSVAAPVTERGGTSNLFNLLYFFFFIQAIFKLGSPRTRHRLPADVSEHRRCRKF